MSKSNLLILVGVFILAVFMVGGFKGLTHNYPRRDVDLLEEVNIGGMSQWIMAQGENPDLPVLLWLHGGPGSSQMPIARYFNNNLEEEFIVIHWDQRGAGKSNPADFDESTMTIEQFLQDTHEMTQYLKERFKKDKIYLLGHSWGTQIGMVAASRYPEDYNAYIGVSQVADHHYSHIIAYKELEERIKEKGKSKDLEKLATLNGPPYADHDEYVTFIKMMNKYNMNMDIKVSKFARIAITSSVYSIKDFGQWLKGSNRGSGPMWEESQGWDILEWAPKIDVPCYFITGDNDYNTPIEPMKRVIKELEAESKELVVIKDAAHMPFFTNPDQFLKELKTIKLNIESSTN